MKLREAYSKAKGLTTSCLEYGKKLTYPETYGFRALPPRLKKVTTKGRRII